MSAATGRNDPCPCGSGLKYKKCCLPREEAGAAARVRLTPRDSALGKLFTFANRVEFDRDHDIAHILFWADRLDACTREQEQELFGSDDVVAKYNTWFAFDVDIDDGRRVIDLFLERQGRSLDPAERAYLERVRESHLSLYSVIEIAPGRGLHVQELSTRRRLFVHERTATEQQLVQWDILGARIVPDEDGRLRFEGALYLYPADAKRDLLRVFRAYRRDYRRNFPHETEGEFLRRHGMIFHHAWLDLVVFRPLPTIVTAEGDEMLLANVVFDVTDADAVRTALAADAAAQVADDGTVEWIEPDGDLTRALGVFRIEGHRGVLETTSRRRAGRGRAWLEAAAGHALSYKTTTLQSVESALRERRTAPAPASPVDVLPEELARVMREMQDRHYRDWLDTQIPALRGKTPREAARSASLRPLLIDLLRTMENHQARDVQRGQPGYDMTWLWSELGIARLAT
jgi:hypothetical protein